MDFPKTRILLVDDDEDYFVIVRDLLDEAVPGGFAVDWVSCCDKATEVIAQSRHDACLLDYHLGECNGLDVLREAQRGGSAVPIVMLTGVGDHEVDVQAIHAGAMDYLDKDRLSSQLLERSIRHAIAHKRALDELREANGRLKRLTGMQRDFLRIVLHDLKSPIGTTTMFLESLGAGDWGTLSDTQQDWIDRSRHLLRGVTGFLHDLQTLASLDVGRLEGTRELVDIAATVESVVADNRDVIAAHGHTMKVEAASGLSPAYGHARLLHEAIANLLTNAAKYTPDGGRIEIRVRAADGATRIEVQDNGIGIAPEDQSRLFQDFVRIRREDVPMARVEGTGLGLSIVRRIAELHGGRITVSSVLDEGSTFTLTLPAPKAAAAADASAGGIEERSRHG
ncbi:MAG TPA: ATP-binding protein [Candidatus Hydrogenedentes bacterium]|nr:ATP-binding protein [Candidatus Hydrogenedentota bacterium]HPG66013.1 ATP-binding protein [Candidatus Hydrogenedentota bacterium]